MELPCPGWPAGVVSARLGVASPPPPCPPSSLPTPPSPVEKEGGRAGGSARPAASPSLCPVPLEGHSRKEAGWAGALSPWWRPARHQHKEGRGGSIAPSPSAPVVPCGEMQSEQMASINTTMEERVAQVPGTRRQPLASAAQLGTSTGSSGPGRVVVCVLGRDSGLLAGWFGDQSFVLSIAFSSRS